MSSNCPPQLHLELPPNTTSFKRSFDQFGFDLDSPSGSGNGAGHPGSDGIPGTGLGEGNDRNKRARNSHPSSFDDDDSSSSASSSLSSSSSSTTLVSSSSSGSRHHHHHHQFGSQALSGGGTIPPTTVSSAFLDSTPRLTLGLPSRSVVEPPPRLPTPEIQDIDMDYSLVDDDDEQDHAQHNRHRSTHQNISSAAMVEDASASASDPSLPSSSTTSASLSQTETGYRLSLPLPLDRFTATIDGTPLSPQLSTLRRRSMSPSSVASSRRSRTPPPVLPPLALFEDADENGDTEVPTNASVDPSISVRPALIPPGVFNFGRSRLPLPSSSRLNIARRYRYHRHYEFEESSASPSSVRDMPEGLWGRRVENFWSRGNVNGDGTGWATGENLELGASLHIGDDADEDDEDEDEDDSDGDGNEGEEDQLEEEDDDGEEEEGEEEGEEGEVEIQGRHTHIHTRRRETSPIPAIGELRSASPLFDDLDVEGDSPVVANSSGVPSTTPRNTNTTTNNATSPSPSTMPNTSAMFRSFTPPPPMLPMPPIQDEMWDPLESLRAYTFGDGGRNDGIRPPDGAPSGREEQVNSSSSTSSSSATASTATSSSSSPFLSRLGREPPLTRTHFHHHHHHHHQQEQPSMSTTGGSGAEQTQEGEDDARVGHTHTLPSPLMRDITGWIDDDEQPSQANWFGLAPPHPRRQSDSSTITNVSNASTNRGGRQDTETATTATISPSQLIRGGGSGDPPTGSTASRFETLYGIGEVLQGIGRAFMDGATSSLNAASAFTPSGSTSLATSRGGGAATGENVERSGEPSRLFPSTSLSLSLAQRRPRFAGVPSSPLMDHVQPWTTMPTAGRRNREMDLSPSENGPPMFLTLGLGGGSSGTRRTSSLDRSQWEGTSTVSRTMDEMDIIMNRQREEERLEAAWPGLVESVTGEEGMGSMRQQMMSWSSTGPSSSDALRATHEMRDHEHTGGGNAPVDDERRTSNADNVRRHSFELPEDSLRDAESSILSDHTESLSSNSASASAAYLQRANLLRVRSRPHHSLSTMHAHGRGPSHSSSTLAATAPTRPGGDQPITFSGSAYEAHRRAARLGLIHAQHRRTGATSGGSGGPSFSTSSPWLPLTLTSTSYQTARLGVASPPPRAHQRDYHDGLPSPVVPSQRDDVISSGPRFNDILSARRSSRVGAAAAPSSSSSQSGSNLLDVAMDLDRGHPSLPSAAEHPIDRPSTGRFGHLVDSMASASHRNPRESGSLMDHQRGLMSLALRASNTRPHTEGGTNSALESSPTESLFREYLPVPSLPSPDLNVFDFTSSHDGAEAGSGGGSRNSRASEPRLPGMGYFSQHRSPSPERRRAVTPPLQEGAQQRREINPESFAPGPFRNTIQSLYQARLNRGQAQVQQRSSYLPPSLPPLPFEEEQERSHISQVLEGSAHHQASLHRQRLPSIDHPVHHHPSRLDNPGPPSGRQQGWSYENDERTNSGAVPRSWRTASPTRLQHGGVSSESPSSHLSDLHNYLSRHPRMEASVLDTPGYSTLPTSRVARDGSLHPLEALRHDGTNASRSQELINRFHRVRERTLAAGARDPTANSSWGVLADDGSRSSSTSRNRPGDAGLATGNDSAPPFTRSGWRSRPRLNSFSLDHNEEPNHSVTFTQQQHHQNSAFLRARRIRRQNSELGPMFPGFQELIRGRGVRRGQPVGDFVSDEDWDPSYENLWAISNLIGEVKPRFTPDDVIASLETGLFQNWKTPDSDKRCPICLDDYEADDVLLKLTTCSHWLHRDCLRQWLRGANTCPVCRETVSGGSASSSRRTSHDASSGAGPSRWRSIPGNGAPAEWLFPWR